jgi:hypothetical protein
MLQQVFLSFVGFWLLLPLVFCCIGWTKHRAVHPHMKTSTKDPDDVIWTKVLKTRLAICLSSNIQILNFKERATRFILEL